MSNDKFQMNVNFKQMPNDNINKMSNDKGTFQKTSYSHYSIDYSLIFLQISNNLLSVDIDRVRPAPEFVNFKTIVREALKNKKCVKIWKIPSRVFFHMLKIITKYI